MAEDKLTGAVKAKVIRKRGVNHDGVHHAKGAVIELNPGQFSDWKAVGIVEAASSRLKGDTKTDA